MIARANLSRITLRDVVTVRAGEVKVNLVIILLSTSCFVEPDSTFRR